MNVFMRHNKVRGNISENTRKEKIMRKEKCPSCFSIEEPSTNKQILLERKCCKSTCTSREVMRRHHSPLAIYSLEAAIGKRKNRLI